AHSRRHQRVRPHRPQRPPRGQAGGEHRHRFRGRQRPDGHQDPRAPAALRLGARQVPRHRRSARELADGGWRRDPRVRRKGPVGPAVARPGSRHRHRVHGALHRPCERGQAPGGRGEEGDHLRAGQGRRHHHRPRRQPGQVRRGQPPRGQQRQLHHQLPGARGQGAARQLRHRARPDDDHPRLHQRPEHPGPAAQGPAPRPRRRPVDDPHDHGRRQGDEPGDSRGEGKDRRHGRARAHARRVGGGPDLRAGPHRHRRRGERRPPGRRRGAAQGHPGVRGAGAGVHRLHRQPGLLHRRRRVHQRGRRAGEGGRLVRQRVGLQLPLCGPCPLHGRKAV
ncbi:MAG: NAD-dependent glyceraldehyde-3-phosphate dehydrogenase, partial [uncultured Gemmatimonadetes bacterium]